MRLSDAIALGRVLIDKPVGASFCGCAIGMGLAATGHKYLDYSSDSIVESGKALADARQEWPWLEKVLVNPWNGYTEAAEWVISNGFHRVIAGEISLETLIDYIHSVEPSKENIFDTVSEEEVEYASVT